MDFTREPIIETIITPKEGYKLVVRSSKSSGQEEYFVDALEVIAFGHALFFRSLERPKAFVVPVTDYEVLEVREARMALKTAGLDRSIKIGGGREAGLKAGREAEKEEIASLVEKEGEQEEALQRVEATAPTAELRTDKKRDRRRHYRKRRGREEREEGVKEEAAAEPVVPSLEDEKIDIPPPEEKTAEQAGEGTATLFSSLLQPPPTLISETINRYRQNELFKGAFYLTEEEQYKPHDKVQELLDEEDEEETSPSLQEPAFEPEEKPSESAEEGNSAFEEVEVRKSEEKIIEEVDEPESGLPLYLEEDANGLEPLFPTENEELIKENEHSPNE